MEATPEDIDVELEELIDVEEEDLIASPVLKRTVPNDLLPTFSPLNFIPCPRGPGRPKVSRQGAASLKRKQEESNIETEAPKKKRGRPAGSKNKKKNEQINNNKSDNSSTSDLPFFDSGDFCQICQFNLNDPIKRGGKVVQCTRCLEYVHELCLL